MKAIEFRAKTSRGKIKIPDEFSIKGEEEVRVIVLIEEKQEVVVTKNNQFKAIKIETSPYKFQRDEANAR